MKLKIKVWSIRTSAPLNQSVLAAVADSESSLGRRAVKTSDQWAHKEAEK